MLLLSLAGQAALGPRPRRFGFRMWVAAGMLAASVASVMYVTPRIEQLRAGVPGGMTTVGTDDPRRVAFGQWHVASIGLKALTLAGGLALFGVADSDRN